jgi:hypothetical protein
MDVAGVEVHIDELALDGFGRVNGEQVAAAFRRELSRLLRRDVIAGGVRPGGGAPLAAATDHAYDLIAGLTLPPTRSARRLGIELARAVHAGLTRPGEPSSESPGTPSGESTAEVAR